MSSYFVSKDTNSGEIVYIEYDKKGYKVTPKVKKEDAILVNKVVFVSPVLTEKLIKKKIDRKIDKLLFELNAIDIDDSDDGNTEHIRDMVKEAERLRFNIINNYKKYVGNTYSRLILEKIKIIIDGYMAKFYLLKEKDHRVLFNREYNDYDKKGRGR